MFKYSFVFLCVVLLSFCSFAEIETDTIVENDTVVNTDTLEQATDFSCWETEDCEAYLTACDLETLWVNEVIDSIEIYLGTPYRYGGTAPGGFDCSGIFYYVFKKFDVKLSRSSRGLAAKGVDVNIDQLQPGDFLFFKGRDLRSSRIGHVAMVTELTENSFKMVHSCSRGLIIEEYAKNSYYTKRFVKAKRMDFEYYKAIGSLD